MATLGEVKSSKKRVDVVNVVRHGQDLIIPDGLTLEQVDKVIHNKMAFDETTVAVNAVIPGFVTDAAYATFRAMSQLYGWVNQVPTPGFFGATPPSTITVEIARGKSVQVPFGRFEIANLDGYLEFGVVENPSKPGVAAFVIGGEIKRRHEEDVAKLVQTAKDILRDSSIYKGQAFRLRVRDDRGKPLPFPTPQFLDLNPAVEREMVFPLDVQRDLDINLFAPIEHTQACRDSKIPLKRGVLLAGDFGVGKTMAAHATALKCVRNGWTYIVADRADELAEILRLAEEHSRPCVVFCEDIDQVMRGERDIDTNAILNIIDGVESKNSELMIVLTTNDIDHIHPSMLRPGRLDAVIYLDKPDAEAAERLARLYARGLIPESEDIREAAALLAGRIPAVIREAVERSKLGAIFFSDDPEHSELLISNEALLHSARRMQFQLEKLEPKTQDKRSETVKAAAIMADAMKEVAVQQGAVAQPFAIPAPIHSTDAVRAEWATDETGGPIDPED